MLSKLVVINVFQPEDIDMLEPVSIIIGKADLQGRLGEVISVWTKYQMMADPNFVPDMNTLFGDMGSTMEVTNKRSEVTVSYSYNLN